MDNNSDWAASTLFSPSKAKAQQAQAKDWASVESWLSKKYGARQVPAFERNEDTLRILLELASLNENMDEQRSYIDRVEKGALHSLSKRISHIDKSLLATLSNKIKSHESLDALAEATIEVRSGSPEVSTLAGSIIDLNSTHFALSEQVERISAQVAGLRTEQKRLRQTLEILESETFQPTHELLKQTSEYVKNTKHLKAKVAEYEEQLTSFRGTQPGEEVVDTIAAKKKILDALKMRLAEATSQITNYQDLSVDPKAARAQVEGAREHLRDLVIQRDRAFEDLAGSAKRP